MAHLGVAVVVEMRLHGLEGAWTDISSDVLADLSCTYGISGGGANDRVASTGSFTDRKSTRLNSSHVALSRMPSSA